MKFSLATIVALVGAASAVSVDFSLVQRQDCIASGGFCFTSIADVNKPCCGGLICRNKPQPNTNICEPEPSPGSTARSVAVEERSDEPAAPRAVDVPVAEEPRWA
ncbi:ec20 protein [Colletotrichum sojae]|uniref:Ec20 protein n=1 Tax=Colletotrichum sojae TaxID=2175907 RepID=A0A8H6MLU4_9PEZI|nr:ec20 protein [Colletotrichum sojae]